MNSATVVAGVAAEIITYAESLGLDGSALRRRYGLPPNVEYDFERHIPVQVLLRMWREVPEQAGDPDFGLHMAERFAKPQANLATLLVASAATVEDGIRMYMERQSAFNQFRPTEWIRDADYGRLVIDTRGFALDIPRAAVEFALAWWWLLIQRSLGGTWAPSMVELAYPRPASADTHLRVFGTMPRFAQPRNVLALSKALLESPLVTTSPQLLTVGMQTAERLAERHKKDIPVEERVRAWMQEAVMEGRTVSIQDAAPTLGMSVRTLQRQLQAAQCPWSALYDQVRADLAKQWIGQGILSTHEIADRLGFSDPAGFFRAFRRWTGAAPSEFRNQSRENSDSGTAKSSNGSTGS